MPSYTAKRFILEGRVQGVGCRAHVYDLVENIGHISGFVRNMSNGSVEVCVKGPEWRLQDLERILRTKLQPPIKIDRLLVEDWQPKAEEFNGFRILR